MKERKVTKRLAISPQTGLTEPSKTVGKVAILLMMITVRPAYQKRPLEPTSKGEKFVMGILPA